MIGTSKQFEINRKNLKEGIPMHQHLPCLRKNALSAPSHSSLTKHRKATCWETFLWWIWHMKKTCLFVDKAVLREMGEKLNKNGRFSSKLYVLFPKCSHDFCMILLDNFLWTLQIFAACWSLYSIISKNDNCYIIPLIPLLF